MSTERIVIVGYKPFPGKVNELHTLMKKHVDILRKEGLASNREAIIMTTPGGTVIEVFGWKSKEAIEAAHTNAAVQKLWGEYAEVCEYIPVGHMQELQNLFSEFSPL